MNKFCVNKFCVNIISTVSRFRTILEEDEGRV